jgi:hypothetical protein
MPEGIKEILTELGYNLKDCGKEYRTTPLYRESNNEGILVISKTDGLWYDFKLMKGGAFEELVRLTLKLDSIEATKEIIESKNFSRKESDYVRDKPTLKNLRTFPNEILCKLKPDHSYWERRGVNKEILEIFEGGLAESGKMANRYMFPIFNNSKKIIGFSGRCVLTSPISSRRPKWKHIGPKNEWVYPLKYNRRTIEDKKEVVLVESIGDMLALWQAGVQNTIVSFGLGINGGIMNYLLQIEPYKITVSFNNDSSDSLAGQQAAEKASAKLANYFNNKSIQVRLPSKNDFGEMTSKEIKRWAKENDV